MSWYVEPVVVNITPAIIEEAGHLRFAISGSIKIPLMPGQVVQDVMSWKASKLDVVKTWKIKSSKPGNFYTVTKMGDYYKCQCVGFQYHKNCRHIKEAKEIEEK